MTSILFLTEVIYCNIFRRNYLRNEKIFLIFFFFWHVRNLDSILKIFKKNMTFIGDVFLNLRTPKKVWLKIPVLEDPLKSNMVKGPKHCWNLNDSTFTMFIDHCQGNSVGKSLS